jgi:hypothetical protein
MCSASQSFFVLDAVKFRVYQENFQEKSKVQTQQLQIYI